MSSLWAHSDEDPFMGDVDHHHHIVKKYLDAASKLLHGKREVPPHMLDRGVRSTPNREKSPVRDALTQQEVEKAIVKREDWEEHPDHWHSVVHEVAELHKEQVHFIDITERAHVFNEIAEANAFMVAIDRTYGWEPGEPHVADRMFSTNVQAALNNAYRTGTLDFKTKKMIDTMRVVSEGETEGTDRLAKVVAVRNLVGGVTSNEAQLLIDEERLGEEDFSEMVHFADKLSLAEKSAMEHHLHGAAAHREHKEKEAEREQHAFHERMERQLEHDLYRGSHG